MELLEALGFFFLGGGGLILSAIRSPPSLEIRIAPSLHPPLVPYQSLRESACKATIGNLNRL